MAYLCHDICCEVPQLVMSDGWEATCGAHGQPRRNDHKHSCWVGWRAASCSAGTRRLGMKSLWSANPMGRADNPFSLPSSIARCRYLGNLARSCVAVAACRCCLSLLTSAFAHCCSRVVSNVSSCCCRRMRAARGAVTFCEVVRMY